jgi:hypothetical protein
MGRVPEARPMGWQAGSARTTTDNIEGGDIQEADMGLRDILRGMKNGPRGQRQPSSSGGGGLSRIMMALLALLAYKSFKGSGGQAAPTDSGNPPDPNPPRRRWL